MLGRGAGEHASPTGVSAPDHPTGCGRATHVAATIRPVGAATRALGTRRSNMHAETAVSTPAANGYAFEGGFPTAETIVQAHDEADLNRAIQAYRFFSPVPRVCRCSRATQRSA
jgi:hypothetical protein